MKNYGLYELLLRNRWFIILSLFYQKNQHETQSTLSIS
jgi:hypothetical protein